MADPTSPKNATKLLEQIARTTQLTLWAKRPDIFFKDIYGLAPYPYQTRVLKELTDLSINRILIMSSAGSGKTKLVACHALWLALPLAYSLNRPVSIVVISGSEDQAKTLYNYIKEAIKSEKILMDYVEGEPLASETKFKNGSVIKAVPNSQKAIQGLHLDVVIVDESCLAGDFVLRDAFRITVKNDSLDRIIFLGTPMYQDSLFVEMYENTDEYPKWKRYHWSNAECPNISAERLAEAKKLSPDVYSIFWEGKPFASSEDTLIPFDYLKQATQNVKLTYDPNFDTYAGVDWGYEHETALTVSQWDGIQWRVFFNEGWRREEYSDLIERIGTLLSQFNVKAVYTDSSSIGENQRLAAEGFPVQPIIFKNERVVMQSNIKALFYAGKVLIDENLVTLKDQLKRYNWDTKKHDDRVDSFMLSLREGDLSKKGKSTDLTFRLVKGYNNSRLRV